jgi:hypothetical protein
MNRGPDGYRIFREYQNLLGARCPTGFIVRCSGCGHPADRRRSLAVARLSSGIAVTLDEFLTMQNERAVLESACNDGSATGLKGR